MRRLAAVSVAAFVALGVARPARAEASSWAFAGSGPASIESRQMLRETVPSLLLEAGLGSSPEAPAVFGGLFKLETLFGHGSDLGVSVRGASSGFAKGDFGVALDLGPYFRFWGEGSNGGAATLWLGAPWGLAVGASGSVGTHDSRSMGLVLGFDFARFSFMRQAGTAWFPNPLPAAQRDD